MPNKTLWNMGGSQVKSLSYSSAYLTTYEKKNMYTIFIYMYL